MKKALSVLLVMAMVLAMIPAVVIIASAEQDGDYTYTVSDSKATITKYTGAGGNITIPNMLGGHPVNVIGNSSFYNCDNLTSITIPFGVITIGYGAFSDCSSLISVIIPDSVVTIWGSAFFACIALNSVFLPDSVETLGEGAFGLCTDLNQFAVDAENRKYSQLDGVLFDKSKTTLIQYPGGKSGAYNIPNSVTKIGNFAFKSCNNMTLGTIPESVTVIGNYAFTNCSTINAVTIPASVVTIGDGAFSDCKSLSQIGLDPRNENFSIVDGVLFNKTRTSLVQYPAGKSGYYDIPVGVVTISNAAFTGCANLASVTIPDSVITISNLAFAGCANLASVTIPDSVITIGFRAFDSCNKLITLAMGTGVENIGSFAFSYCAKLKSIVIYNSSTTIGNGAFLGCSSLTIYGISGSTAEVYANGNSIPFIDEGLIIINLPDKTTYYLGEPLDLTGIQVILIDNLKIEKITDYEVGGYDANAQGTQEITISYDNKFAVFNIIVKSFEDDYTYTVSDSKATITKYTGVGGDITIPNQLGGYPVTSIGDYSFFNLVSITAVTIPNSVIIIGNQAFGYCHKLITINIPNSVTGLGWRAFYGCTNLTQINVDTGNTALSSLDGVLFNSTKTAIFQYPSGKAGAYKIPNGVTYIGTDAFFMCKGLISVTIPVSVTDINDLVFEDCGDLTQINVDTGNLAYSSLDGVLFNKTRTKLCRYPGGKPGAYIIPNSVISIGDYAFHASSVLTAVSIPNSVTSIGYRSFFWCSGITALTIPNSETSIGSLAFYCCKALTAVMIPEGVTSIGRGAFAGCERLTSVTILNSVISIGDGAFEYRPVLKIFCYGNSTAHVYAINNSINYELINISPSTEGPGCYIDYVNNVITGLSGGITSLEGYFDVESGYELSYIPTSNGFGTGTIVNVVSTTKNAMTNSVVASYTVIIYGDVNGDASIDSIDAGLVVDYENYVVSWDPTADAAKIKAADLNGDGKVDSMDAGIAVDAENYVITIDQTTGLVA